MGDSPRQALLCGWEETKILHTIFLESKNTNLEHCGGLLFDQEHSGLRRSYATSGCRPTRLDGLTLHHLVLAVQDGPPDPGHLLLRRQIGSVLGERIRQVPGVHLSQLLKVAEGCGEVPVLPYKMEREREVTPSVWSLTSILHHSGETHPGMSLNIYSESIR